MIFRQVTLERLAILALLALAIVYFAALRPLSRRVVEADAPLHDLGERLARATLDAGLARGTSFGTVSNRLQALRMASNSLAESVSQSLPRLEQPPEVRQRLEEPFQLVEFLNESQRRLEELGAQAQSVKVALAPGLPRGFPRYQPELARPELLWVQLAMMNRVVRTAIRAGVREVREVSVEPLPLQEGMEEGGALTGPTPPARPASAWSVLRLHVTTVGSVDALGRLLVALALTPEELKRLGLPDDMAGRPACFIDQVLLRRTQLDVAEQAQLELVVSTVVPNDAL